MTLILGVDPGLVHTGWGLINMVGSNLKYISSGSISPNTKESIAHRLKEIYTKLSEVISEYKPEESAVEETYVNKNASSSLVLGQARGAIMLTLAIANLPISEYAARLVKKTVVGVGKAEKNQVFEMLKLLLPGAKIGSYDEADAIAVAICHANHKKSYNIYKGKNN
jgi:crossover junction endodeoxyribonuclease RuvC